VTLSFSHVTYSILPACVCTSLTVNFHALLDNYIFVLPVYHKYLDPNKHSTLKMGSDIYASIISPN